jgi:transposase
MTGLAQVLEENSRLRETLRERDAVIEQLMEAVATQSAMAAQFSEQIGALKASNELFAKHFEFLKHRRRMAAAERLQAAELQAPLFEGLEVVAPPRDPALQPAEAEAEADAQPDPQPAQGTRPEKRKAATHQRKGRRDVSALPFPRERVLAPVNPNTCDRGSGERRLIEPRVTHRVGWTPGQFTVVEVHQERCRCETCPKAEVWVAPEPCLLPGAMCDDSLLARVIVDKFGDHIPLNRQADRMTRQGFPINENVLSGWVLQGAKQVPLLVSALRRQVVEADTLLGDDSGLPVQDGTDGRLANGRLWVFTDRQQAFFAFSRTKEGEHPAAVLKALEVKGARLVVDGGSEYNAVVDQLGLSRGGCWSHLRRYFFDASLQHSDAKEGLRTLHDLFMLERQFADDSDADRLAARQARSAPLVDGFYTWVRALSPKVRPGSKLGIAVGYALSQETRMRLFLAHGDVPLHNNLSELLLRQPIVGRKNWLFSGSEGGAFAAADWFSLIGSCRMQKVDPWVYLHDVFGRLLDYPSQRVHELTPLKWRLAVEEGTIVPRSPGARA